MENKLSKEELNHLLGGVSNTGNTGSLPGGTSSNIPNGTDIGIDIRNINKVSGCTCEYNNSQNTISNENGIIHCRCVCWPR